LAPNEGVKETIHAANRKTPIAMLLPTPLEETLRGTVLAPKEAPALWIATHPF
jgi:hypothetical protein